MSTEKETTFCTHKGYNTVAPCDDSCFSTKKEKWNFENLICKLPHCRCMQQSPCSNHHYSDECFRTNDHSQSEMELVYQSESIEWEKEFVESGASIEHDRWARWQKYMFSKGTVDENGVFHLPKEFVERWFRQIDTKYADLSEPEKESDRKESRNYLPIIENLLEQERKRLAKRIIKDDVTCPEAYGFEGRDTFSACEKCVVCELRSIINK